MSYYNTVTIRGTNPSGSLTNVTTDFSGSIKTSPNSLVSNYNTTYVPLSANAAWSGSWEDVSGYASITTITTSSVGGVLTAEFSMDANIVDRSITLSDGTTGDMGIHSLVPAANYFRMKLVNGNAPQSVLRIQSILHPSSKVAIPTSRLSQTLTGYSDALNVRAALVGQTEGGNYWGPVSSDGEGHLEVAIQSPRSGFGEISMISPTPAVQLDFVYGLNPLVVTLVSSSNSAYTQVTASLACVGSGNATNTSASIISRRYTKYRAGQSILSRFTAAFAAPQPGSFQYAGVSNSTLSDGFLFGYSGSSFGIFHINGNDGTTFISQSAWNNDICNGADGTNNRSGYALTQSAGNVYSVQYQYLGFGNPRFFIENPANGQMTLVHEIQYAGSATSSILQNPSLNIVWMSKNTTNNTNLVLRAGSGAMFVEGHIEFLGPVQAIDNSKASITTQTNLVTIKNCNFINGFRNRSQLRIRSIAFASDGGNNISVIRGIINATLGGSPAFSPISGSTADNGNTITGGNSLTSYDTAGTTVVGGNVVFNSAVARNTGNHIDVTNLDLFVNPGETFTLAGSAGASATLGTALNWNEDI